MNQGVYDGFPGDIKKAFDQYSGDWAVEFYGKTRDEQELHAKEVAAEKGMELIVLPAAEVAKAKKLMEPVKANYAAELESKGLPGKKALQELMNFRGK